MYKFTILVCLFSLVSLKVAASESKIWVQCVNEGQSGSDIQKLVVRELGSSRPAAFEFSVEYKQAPRMEAFEADLDESAVRGFRGALDSWGTAGDWHSGGWNVVSRSGDRASVHLDLVHVSGGQSRMYATLEVDGQTSVLGCY